MADYGQAKQVLNQTQIAINATQQLRMTVNNAFEFLKDGISGQEGKSQFLQKFQDLLQAMNKDFTDLEKIGNAMTVMPELSPAPLGPAGHLCMESNADENNLFEDTLMAYQWYAKLHNRATIGANLMHAYKRTSPTSATAIVRSRRGAMVTQSIKPHTLNSVQVDNYLQNSLQRHCPDSLTKVIHVQGITRIVHVTIGKVFFALILFKNFLIEKVIVRGLDENVTDDADCPDMFTPSRYECMRQITDHAASAMLCIDQLPQTTLELKPRFMMSWLNSHRNLFTDSCQKCGKILNNGLPPTFRDFKTHAPLHATCR